MLLKQRSVFTIRGIEFGFTLGWFVTAGGFFLTMQSKEYYDRYLSILEFILPFTITPAFPETQLGMSVFAIALICGIYGCVLLHEAGHASAAQHYGISVDGIYLWLAGGVAQIETFPTTPRKEFIITIAGPAVTAVLAPVFLLGSLGLENAGFPVAAWFALVLALFNAGMLVLNLTPAFPLDGGRIFRSVLAKRFQYLTATTYATHMTMLLSACVGIAAVVTGEYGYVMLAGIVSFLAMGTRKATEQQYTVDGPVTDLDHIRFRDQNVAFGDGVPATIRAEYISNLNEVGATIVSGFDRADIVITMRSPFSSELQLTEPGEMPPATAFLSAEQAYEYFDQHGMTPEQPKPTYSPCTDNPALPPS